MVFWISLPSYFSVGKHDIYEPANNSASRVPWAHERCYLYQYVLFCQRQIAALSWLNRACVTFFDWNLQKFA